MNIESEEKFKREFGARVRARRMELDLSQKDFGDLVNLSRVSIANIEGGRQGIYLHQIISFAEHLRMPADKLLPQHTINELKHLPKDERAFVDEIVREARSA
ncbi:MAG: helix-turn-helix transcriptional regulator [Alphaproteobacteria bacterium]|nr:helix-turn-helix transcriptional regulator [Alphaproteobacteria bacterium]